MTGTSHLQVAMRGGWFASLGRSAGPTAAPRACVASALVTSAQGSSPADEACGAGCAAADEAFSAGAPESTLLWPGQPLLRSTSRGAVMTDLLRPAYGNLGLAVTCVRLSLGWPGAGCLLRLKAIAGLEQQRVGRAQIPCLTLQPSHGIR